MADRNALLSQIQRGKALKATVTNDRSAAQLTGSVVGESGSAKPARAKPPAAVASTAQSAPGLGGLFAGGMPTLKHRGGVDTGRGINGNGHTNNTQSTAAPPLATKPKIATAPVLPTRPSPSSTTTVTSPPLPNRPSAAAPPALPSRTPPALPNRKPAAPVVPPRQPPPRPTSRKPPPPPPPATHKPSAPNTAAASAHHAPSVAPHSATIAPPARGLPAAPHSAPLPIIKVAKVAVAHPPAVEGRWTFPEWNALPKPRAYTHTEKKDYKSDTPCAYPLDLNALAARNPQRPPPPPPFHHHVHP
ncbi:hypothetical protein BDF19DRAFT_466367 [Syncephalis fuscata]|nr:hypothetical protein BDF19DRAFT_466367 [Syncephalis fuscata]